MDHDEVIQEGLSADESCRTAAPSGGFVNQGFEPQAIAFTASFEAVPTAANVDAVVGFSAGAADAFTDLAAAVRFNPDGFIDVRRGGTYAADVAMPYQAGATHTVDVLIDVLGHSYSVLVNGTLLARNYAFRTQQARVASLSSAAVIVDSPAGSLTVCAMEADPAEGALYAHDVLRYGGAGAPAPLPNGRLLLADVQRTLTLDARGKVVREVQHGGERIARDRAGNVYLAGTFAGTRDDGGGAVTSAGGLDVFVSKYDAAWNPLWTRRFGGTANDFLAALAVGARGDIALLTGPSSRGGQGSTETRVTTAGATTWTVPSDAAALDLDPAGNTLSARTPFGGGLTVWKRNASAAPVWTRNFAAQGAEVSFVRSDPGGSVVMAGRLNGTIDFGGPTLTARSDEGAQAFVAKLDPTGAHVYGAIGSSFSVRSLAVDAAGNAYLSGMRFNVDRPRLDMFDPAGQAVAMPDVESLFGALHFGSGGDVAVDPSGSVYWQLSARIPPDDGLAYLVKLTPP